MESWQKKTTPSKKIFQVYIEDSDDNSATVVSFFSQNSNQQLKSVTAENTIISMCTLVTSLSELE